MTNATPRTVRADGLSPVASPAARWIAMLTGLVFLGLAFAAGRELWVRHAAPQQQSWAQPFTDYIGHLSYQPWMLYAAVPAIIIAVLLLITVFKPRPRTHRRLVDEENVWMRPVDIARMCTANAEKIVGVKHAHTVVRHNSVRITITGDHTDPTLPERVSRTIGPLLSQIAEPTELSVTVNDPEEARS